jgi:hypothetical protein
LADGRKSSGRSQALIWWYGLMAVGGLGFGALADRRPFGEGILVHPLVMFFVTVGAALLALRVLAARPVPEVIPDRALITGCVVGLVAFLAGNLLGVHAFAAY